MFYRILAVGCGGFVGAVTRWLVSGWVNNIAERRWGAFPCGTLAVNLAGCFIIGFLIQWSETRYSLSPQTKLFILTGFLGALTTFSTFGHETFELIRQNSFLFAGLNAGLNLVVGLTAVWLGHVLARACGAV